jgi:signal transduction histidine kinase
VFERLYTSRTVPGRTLGTGIGLAIVRELAHAMGGDARVVPIDTVGTRFVVTFPARVS